MGMTVRVLVAEAVAVAVADADGVAVGELVRLMVGGRREGWGWGEIPPRTIPEWMAAPICDLR